MHDNPLITGLVLGALAVVLFAASLPATRLAVFALDPNFVTAARAAIAGILAAGVLLLLRRPVPWRDLPRLVTIALCLVIGFPGLMAIAMTTLSSAHGGIILGLLPIATAIAAVVLVGERPSLFFWAMSVLGAALVVAFSLRDNSLTPEAGDLLLFASVAICGMGYALSGALARRMPGWEVISWAVVLSLPVSLPCTFLFRPENPGAMPASAWAGLLYVAIVSQYLGFWLWNNALAMGGVARVGQIQLLQPFATLAIAAFLLGEAIDARTLIFCTAVVAVVAFGLRARIGTIAALPVAQLAVQPVESERG
jgi:drug/metabolite transporter (DMT)-like permease